MSSLLFLYMYVYVLSVCSIPAARSYDGSGSGSGLMLSGMEPVTVLRGEPVLIPCQSSAAYPLSNVEWYQNGTQVGSDNSGVQVYTNLRTHTHMHVRVYTHAEYTFINQPRGRSYYSHTCIGFFMLDNDSQYTQSPIRFLPVLTNNTECIVICCECSSAHCL